MVHGDSITMPVGLESVFIYSSSDAALRLRMIIMEQIRTARPVLPAWQRRWPRVSMVSFHVQKKTPRVSVCHALPLPRFYHNLDIQVGQILANGTGAHVKVLILDGKDQVATAS